MVTVGVVWMFGPAGLICCGALVFLAGILLGFVPQPEKKEVGK